jgi:hypothetical protein
MQLAAVITYSYYQTIHCTQYNLNPCLKLKINQLRIIKSRRCAAACLDSWGHGHLKRVSVPSTFCLDTTQCTGFPVKTHHRLILNSISSCRYRNRNRGRSSRLSPTTVAVELELERWKLTSCWWERIRGKGKNQERWWRDVLGGQTLPTCHLQRCAAEPTTNALRHFSV